jgi:ketosteroid isomerase-like protein
MKRFLVFFSSIVFISATAQNNVDGLIRSEKNFAAYSVAHGTRDAFLNFLDSSGIVFEKGQPVNGMVTWSKKENGSGILNWTPQFAEIAMSNDFGYTSGPYTFQNANRDSVVASGQYATVWHVNARGEWKFLVDLGVGMVPVHQVESTKKILHHNPAKNVVPFIESEKNFIRLFSKDPLSTYIKYLSNHSILNRNGILPAESDDEKLKIIRNTPALLQMNILGSGISSSGDLAYVYGSVSVEGKTDNYLRIWRKEKHQWKLAFEVLRY